MHIFSACNMAWQTKPPASKAPVQFGGVHQLLYPKDGLEGYHPNMPLVKLFGAQSGRQDGKAFYGRLIENPRMLEEINKVLKLPKIMLDIDWEKEIYLLIAQERNGNTPSLPASINFDREKDTLNVELFSEKEPGSGFGTAWYLARVQRSAPVSAGESDKVKAKIKTEHISHKTRLAIPYLHW